MSLIPQNGSSRPSLSTEGDSILENLIEECTNRLQAGESIDVDELARRHPEHADRLRRLLPSLEMMAEVGRTSLRPLGADFHTTVSLDPPQSGPFELGDYHVHHVIGRGGMGIVYEAIQVSLNRRVALKILPFAVALDPHHLRRFQTEAQAAAQLHHTNIVPVFSVGCERGVHFYAMQFIEGRTLATVIQERRERVALTSSGTGFQSVPVASTGRMPVPLRDPEYVRSVARLGIQAAEALDHAHCQGIIHRDVKPANLLVDLHGNLWITDFGLARFLNETGLTLTGDLIGTLRYMSPEQALGKRMVLDHRTDIYSLGATLYELLTLNPVVGGGDRQDVLRRIAQDEPIPPRRIDPAIPRDLETILLRSLARDPEDRYAKAQELADDLRRFLGHRPIKARRPSVVELAAKWLRRHPGLAASAVLVLVLALIGLAASLIAVDSERARTAEKARQAEGLAQTLEWELYISRVNQAHGDYQAGNLARAEATLAACPEPLRNWEWWFVRGLCHQERYAVRVHELPDGVDRLPVVFTPDGSKWISGAGNTNFSHQAGVLKLWDTVSGRCLRDLAPDGSRGIRTMAISPDGLRIALGFVGSGNPIQVREAATGRLVGELGSGDDQDELPDLAFSPDGRRLAVIRNNRATYRLTVWDVANRTRLMDGPARPGVGFALSFHPEGGWVVTTAVGDGVWLWDAQTGALIRDFLGHERDVYDVAFSRDGRRIATAGWDQTVRVRDVAGAATTLVIPCRSGFVESVAFSPDGDRIAASSGQSLTIWDAITGRELLTMRGEGHFGTGLAFSADGRSLLTSSQDGTVRLWDLTGTAPRVLHSRGWVNQVAFSPGGDRLVGADAASVGEIWDVRTGALLRALDGQTDAVRAAQFTPDGSSIVTASWDASVRIWTEATGLTPRTILGPSPDDGSRRLKDRGTSINDVALSPDGSRLAIAGWDWRVIVRDLTSAAEPLIYRGHPGIVWSVAFSPDGRAIASAGADRTVRVWDSRTGQDLWFTMADLPDGSTTQRRTLVFSPDGRILAGCIGHGARGPFAVQLWDAATGAPVRTLSGAAGQINAVTFSPDGTRIATAGEDRTVTLWDTATGQGVFTLRGHTAAVLSVAFSPDGRLLASGSIDATVRIWEAP
ncbi:MAG: WD40 repeat domain-containing serine/threonine protein kinase [Isosphaeraceae bacterium]